jgi:hypothetical protein
MNAKVGPKGQPEVSATALQRMLRRMNPFVGGQGRPLATHGLLMEESERRLSDAAHSGDDQEEIVASRLLDSPRDFRRWEDEHALLMRRVAAEQRHQAQRVALLSTSLTLVHRKALFEYLRARKVRGLDRERLLAQFHTGTDYMHSVVAEHGNYLRSTASFICSRHVGTHLLHDTVFSGPLLRYERLYARYFDGFCDTVLAQSTAQSGSYSASGLARLKNDVNDLRASLIALARSH